MIITHTYTDPVIFHIHDILQDILHDILLLFIILLYY